MANRRCMHNRSLHDILASFVEEAAWQLASEVSEGAEIPFELIEQGRSSAPLYCYRPLTGGFIAQRVGELAKLPSYPPARQGFEGLSGLDDYLRARGRKPPSDRRAKGDAALQAFLTAVWADATDFVYESSRFEAAYLELETHAYSTSSLSQVLAPVEGLVIESDRVELGGGVALVRAEAIKDAPDELRADAFTTMAVVSQESDHGASPGLETAGRSLRRLQTALRLWDDAEPAVGPGAWARTDGGSWLHVALASGSRRQTDDCLLGADEEDALRAFCSLVDRRTPRAGELAWALRRFELGCERATALEALTDWLMAARALLADPDHGGYESLAERLAALCAHPEDYAELHERLAATIALERSAIAGHVRPDPGVETLIAALGTDIRSVLRDVLCGHLDPDLRRLADELRAVAAEHATTT